MRILLALCMLCCGCASQPQRVTNLYLQPPPMQTYGNVKGITKSGSTELDRIEVNFGFNKSW